MKLISVPLELFIEAAADAGGPPKFRTTAYTGGKLKVRNDMYVRGRPIVLSPIPGHAA